MTYEESIAYIHAIPKFSKKLGNDALEKLLDILGNPQKDLTFIHIAGTNGKGSVAAMTEAVLRCGGYTTGLFTSPFIEIFNERIKVNNEMIKNEELARLTSEVVSAMNENNVFVSEFAFITVVAFLYFKIKKCDFVVLEVGMGGRLDATNVIEKSLVTVITSISLDHTEFLGDTIEKIAYEKSGIIKDNSNVVLYPIQKKEAYDVILKKCNNTNSTLYAAELPTFCDGGFEIGDEKYKLSLGGDYQIYNGATCVKIFEVLSSLGYGFSKNVIKAGLKAAFWPARFEWIRENVVLDGCHNVDGVQAFCSSFKKLNKKNPILITAFMKDKDVSGCVGIFSELFSKIIVTHIDMPRCMSPEELLKEFSKFGKSAQIIENPIDALKCADKCDNCVCVCGSLYLVAEVRRHLIKH